MPVIATAGGVLTPSVKTDELTLCSFHTQDTLRVFITQDHIETEIRKQAVNTIGQGDDHTIYQWDSQHQYFAPLASTANGNADLARHIQKLLEADARRDMEATTFYALDGHFHGGLWRGFDETREFAVVFTTAHKAADCWQKAKEADATMDQTEPQIIAVRLRDLRERGFPAALVDSDDISQVEDEPLDVSGTMILLKEATDAPKQ